MGRYAHFSAAGETCEQHEYKFWSAIQESEIPWGKEEVTRYVQEYDEDEADDDELTKKERKTWRKHAEKQYSEVEWEALPEDVKGLLCERVEESYSASDDDSDLPAYKKEVAELAECLGVPVFDHKEGEDLSKALLEYDDMLWQKTELLEFTEKGDDHHLNKHLADLSLKTTICALLARWKSYHVTYEV